MPRGYESKQKPHNVIVLTFWKKKKCIPTILCMHICLLSIRIFYATWGFVQTHAAGLIRGLVCMCSQKASYEICGVVGIYCVVSFFYSFSELIWAAAMFSFRALYKYIRLGRILTVIFTLAFMISLLLAIFLPSIYSHNINRLLKRELASSYLLIQNYISYIGGQKNSRPTRGLLRSELGSSS